MPACDPSRCQEAMAAYDRFTRASADFSLLLDVIRKKAFGFYVRAVRTRGCEPDAEDFAEDVTVKLAKDLLKRLWSGKFPTF